MKAAVLGETASNPRRPEPEPKPNEVLIRVRASSLNRADLLVAGHQHGPRRRRFAHRSRMRGRGRGGRQRGEGLQARRPRDGSAPGGYAEYAVTDCGPRASHSRQQHDLRAGGLHAGRAADHAQRHRHRGPAQARRDPADPGRELGRRPDGHADRQTHGRLAGDGHVDQCRAPARGSRNSAAISRSTRATRSGRSRSRRRPAAKASTSSSTWCRAASSTGTCEARAILGRIVNVGRLGGMKANSTSTCMRSSASTISASPTAPARSTSCARSCA